MFRLYAEKNKLTVEAQEPLTSGSVNIYRVQFTFGRGWRGLEKTVVFKAGNDTASVLLDDTNKCTIPWEVLTNPNKILSIGVYGTQGGTVVLPTVWATLGTILEGVKPGRSAGPPTPGVYDQILAELKRARGYTHKQTSASDVWRIKHDLGKMPSVTVVDSAGTQVIGEVRYLSDSEVEISFIGAFSGKAYLN